MIDFRSLSYFLIACEHENLGSAARELDIAPSTLSASLKSLEAGFGVSLFRKHGAGLSSRRLAHWLYRASVPLLLLEDFARRRTSHPPDTPAVRLQIDIHLRLAFGRFRRALANAITETARVEPLVLVDPRWPLETGESFGAGGLDSLGFSTLHHLRIEAVARPPDLGAGEVLLREDPWVLVRRRYSAENDLAGQEGLAKQSLMVPAFPPALVDQIVAYAAARGNAVKTLSTSPEDWPQLLDEYPGASFLLPGTAVAARLGLTNVEVTPLDPPIKSTLIGRSDRHPVVERFLERLAAAFDEDQPSGAFRPELTRRRIRYFNLANELGRISAAARTANVAQPAMSQQLRKLEESLGAPLFDRRTFGLVRTETSAQFARAAELLEKRLRELEISGATASLAEGGRLSLGILPSVSHHGHLLNRIAEATFALRERFPAMNLAVCEAPNGTLQNMVLRGGLGLAIVETAPSQMPRLPLDTREELAVIADPKFALLPPGPVRLTDLISIPLALPSAIFGLRQLFDGAIQRAGLDIRPKHEIDALTMLIVLLAREPVATIMPASAVREEIVRGELVAHPIIEPTIDRRLFVIYSGDRSLTDAERDFVRLLREHLAAPDGDPRQSP